MTASHEPHSVGAARLHEIAASLAAIGLVTRLHRTRAGTDLTATLHPSGHRDVQVVVDEDGYTELRYWASLSSTPSAAAAAIASALEALTESQSLAKRRGPTCEPVAGYDGAVTERAEGVGMTGPHDHLAEQGRVPDQSRPREADQPHDSQVRPDDLEGRLERLPPNHPSSPYRDDGSRKPPPPDLTKYELPLPDDSDSHSDPDLPANDEARTYPDGSWEWKEAKLSPERSLIADQAIGRCHDTEGRDVNANYGDRGLTPAMRRVEAQLEHGHLVEDTEKFALKDPDRFKEKFAKLIATDPDVNPAELVHRIRDGVRYTFIYEDSNYSSGVTDVCETITAAGYELYECKNAWVDEAKIYQGVNSTWREPDHGILFEVQVHTPASWHAKQESHPLYEVIESLSSNGEQRAEAARRQREIFSQVPIPPDVSTIASYRKEGW